MTAAPRRVAITGLGAVTPVGLTAPTTWAALIAGRTGIARIERFDASGISTRWPRAAPPSTRAGPRAAR